MKLVTKEITRTEAFRQRLETLLFRTAAKWQFKSKNPNSVDGEDRVTGVTFRSVPQIYKITPAGDGESQIEGAIEMELCVETQVHGLEGEKTISEIRACTGRFRVDVAGPPRKSSKLDDDAIKSLTFKLRQFVT